MCIRDRHVIERNGRIDEKTKESRAHQIPECDGDKVIDWPLVGLDPRARPAEREVFIGFKSDENERDHFERAEGCAECEHGGGSAAEVEVMERSDHTTGKEDHGGEEDGPCGGSAAQQSHTDKEE